MKLGGSQREAEVKESAKKTTEGPKDGNKTPFVPNFLEEHQSMQKMWVNIFSSRRV